MNATAEYRAAIVVDATTLSDRDVLGALMRAGFQDVRIVATTYEESRRAEQIIAELRRVGVKAATVSAFPRNLKSLERSAVVVLAAEALAIAERRILVPDSRARVFLVVAIILGIVAAFAIGFSIFGPK